MNSADYIPNSGSGLSEVFRELLGFLIREPFAISNSFQDLSFEEIGLILEEPFGGEGHLMESYDSCKSTYCLMLIELELEGRLTVPAILNNTPLNKLSELAIFHDTNASVSTDKVSQLISELDLNLENEPKTALNEPNSPVLSVPQAESNHPKLIVFPEAIEKQSKLNPLTLEYVRTSKSFEADLTLGEDSTRQQTARRAVVHFSIGAIEIEVFNRLKDDLNAIWSKRCEKIQSLLEEGNFRFNQTNEERFQIDEQKYGHHLYENKYPRLGTLHCLKYLTLTKTVENLHPTVFELGTVIYFWGTDETCELTALNSLTRDQRIELAFRLFRMDRIKAVASNFNRALSPEDHRLFLEDSKQIFETLDPKSSEQGNPKAA